jgi:hypothetical protein
MRWFILLAALGCILIGGAYYFLNDTIVITNYNQVSQTAKEWALVKFNGDGTNSLYEFESVKGLKDIAKSLWPLWTLVIVILFLLFPVANAWYDHITNAQIAAAKEAQIEAEERARKAELDAKKYEQKAKSWAEERVNSAYQEQLSRVKKDLEGEWDSFHKQKNQVLERESAIQNRERTAQQIEKAAKERVDNIVEQYNQEKDRFEAEMLDMARARDNAQAGYKRIKMKLDRKKNLSF